MKKPRFSKNLDGLLAFGDDGVLLHTDAIDNPRLLRRSLSLMRYAGLSDENWKACQRRYPLTGKENIVVHFTDEPQD